MKVLKVLEYSLFFSKSQSLDSVSGVENGVSTENPLMTFSSTSPTTVVMNENGILLKTLNFKDYDEITFDPTQKSHQDNNNNSCDEDLNAVNRAKRESENCNEIESTTIDVPITMHQVPHFYPPQNFHNTNNKFSHYYPPSANPHLQYVSITTTIPPKSNKFFDFSPSQPDYINNYVPRCSTESHRQILINYNYIRNF